MLAGPCFSVVIFVHCIQHYECTKFGVSARARKALVWRVQGRLVCACVHGRRYAGPTAAQDRLLSGLDRSMAQALEARLVALLSRSNAREDASGRPGSRLSRAAAEVRGAQTRRGRANSSRRLGLVLCWRLRLFGRGRLWAHLVCLRGAMLWTDLRLWVARACVCCVLGPLGGERAAGLRGLYKSHAAARRRVAGRCPGFRARAAAGARRFARSCRQGCLSHRTQYTINNSYVLGG